MASVEHEILNAHKYKKISRNSAFFSGSDKPRMLFFLLIKVEMPTVVGISTFISRKHFMLNSVEHEKSLIKSAVIIPFLVTDLLNFTQFEC